MLIFGCTQPPTINITTVGNDANNIAFSTAYDIEEGSALDLVIETGNPTATITTSTLPTNAAVKDGIFSFTPDYTQSGIYPVTFTITIGDKITTKSIGIRVLNVIHITTPSPQPVSEGAKAGELTFQSTDPPGTIVNYAADLSGLPADQVTFDPNTGKLNFAPTFTWLDKNDGAVVITVTAEGQELDTGKVRTSTAKVLYQVNEATSFKQELVPLFMLPSGAALATQYTQSHPTASPPPEYIRPEGHNCVFCHDGQPGAFAEMDFTPDAIHGSLVNHDPTATGTASAACGEQSANGVKRVVPGDITKSLWFMKISGTDGNGNPGPPCGVQMAFQQPWNYWTVTDQKQWFACGDNTCRQNLICVATDVTCKMSARLVRKAKVWIEAGALDN